MEHNETLTQAELSDQQQAETGTVAEQLANARREIAELQSQIQWLERSYE